MDGIDVVGTVGITIGGIENVGTDGIGIGGIVIVGSGTSTAGIEPGVMPGRVIAELAAGLIPRNAGSTNASMEIPRAIRAATRRPRRGRTLGPVRTNLRACRTVGIRQPLLGSIQTTIRANGPAGALDTVKSPEPAFGYVVLAHLWVADQTGRAAGITSAASRSSCCASSTIGLSRISSAPASATERIRATQSSAGPAKMCSDHPPRP